ncbi:MAG TPA: WhiB family transcriptional regulator [Acidimicrobiales bacterium]|nr:WhiB family transcriptional regulator [Acidimicrobiales bacterium]
MNAPMYEDGGADKGTGTGGGASWVVRARCRDLASATFFPSNARELALAYRYCGECPVRGACLDHALQHRIELGVWGGTSPRERQLMTGGHLASVTAGRSGAQGAGSRQSRRARPS